MKPLFPKALALRLFQKPALILQHMFVQQSRFNLKILHLLLELTYDTNIAWYGYNRIRGL